MQAVIVDSFQEEIMAEYAHPEVLVTTELVASHAKDPNVRVA